MCTPYHLGPNQENKSSLTLSTAVSMSFNPIVLIMECDIRQRTRASSRENCSIVKFSSQRHVAITMLVSSTSRLALGRTLPGKSAKIETDERHEKHALCDVYWKARKSLYKALSGCQGTSYARSRERYQWTIHSSQQKPYLVFQHSQPKDKYS
jgi:hypothetical protein